MRQRLVTFGCQAALCLAMSACGSAYLTQAALGQRDLLSRRVPIEEILADESAADELKQRLVLVLQIRDFASSELGLPDNDSYRSYADLDRDYAVWNVFAAAEFSVQAKQWCFPIVGCVAYRGYFSKVKADTYADKLDNKGFDVFVGGVAAYSTLGHFDDPVLNTMIQWDDLSLAAVIFHELTHQRLYIKNNSSFSESLASVVEAEGMRLWLNHLAEEKKLGTWQQRKARQQRFADLVSETRDRLAEIYKTTAVDEADEAGMRANKADEFARLQSEFQQLKIDNPAYSSYDKWFARDLNNAHLVSVATYNDLVPCLEELLVSVGYDLDVFFVEAAKLAKKKTKDKNKCE